MAQITVEYMIMVPVLILQIFLFPLTATIIMDNWNESRRTIELQETAGHIGSTIQQLYYTINRASMNGSVRVGLEIPTAIGQYAYTVTLCNYTHVEPSYAITVMNITLSSVGTTGFSSTLVTFGNNIDWEDNLAFNSTSPNLAFTASKTGDNILLTLGGT